MSSTLKALTSLLSIDRLRGFECLNKILNEYGYGTSVDIGGGCGDHWKILSVTSNSFTGIDAIRPPGFSDINGVWIEKNFPYINSMDIPENVDLVWCSHCLEHQLNPHEFLRGLFHLADDNGVVAITVPPMKDRIVGGHVTLWNAGLLLYNMILAGFDCSEARVFSDDNDVSVIVRKKRIDQLPDLNFARGDIEKLSQFFPFEAKQGFNGKILSHNW